jgi:hypothetical protein
MKCFNHGENYANGSCKYCSKALCKECSEFIQNIVCCKDNICKTQIAENLEIEERAKKIYSIGKYKRNKISPIGLFSLSLGLIIGFQCIYDSVKYGFYETSLLNVLLGITFISYGLYNFLRKDQLNI